MVCDKGTRRRRKKALDGRTKGDRGSYIESMDSRGDMMPSHGKLVTVAFNVLREPGGRLKLGGASADAGYRPWSMHRRCVVLRGGLHEHRRDTLFETYHLKGTWSAKLLVTNGTDFIVY